MAKKKTDKQKSRENRAHQAALRQIAKEEDMSVEDAELYYPQAIAEVVYRRPYDSTQRRFLAINPDFFREVEEGKPAMHIWTFGPIIPRARVMQIIAMKTYWATVRIVQDEMDLSLEEARAFVGEKGIVGALTELGAYEEDE